MTIRLSTGLRNALTGFLGFQGAMNRGVIKVFTGSQPATADAAETGTLLGTMSLSSGAVTRETRATATLQITGGSGTLTSVKVGTLHIVDEPADITWATSNAATASVICDAINRTGMAEATVSTDTITVKPRPGMGDLWNGLALASAGITGTGSNFASGADPVNGLVLASPSAGVIGKPSGAVWSMSGVASGTAGWFRFYPSDTADNGSIISGVPYYCRIDGTCGVGSGDLQLSSLTVASGTPISVDVFNVTMPAA